MVRNLLMAEAGDYSIYPASQAPCLHKNKSHPKALLPCSQLRIYWKLKVKKEVEKRGLIVLNEACMSQNAIIHISLHGSHLLCSDSE